MEPMRRVTARVVPVSPAGEVLVLLDRDPAVPGALRWGTIGGAVDPGETLVDAAVREMHEETGLVIASSDLTAPFLRHELVFSYAGVSYLGDSTFFALPLRSDVEISFDFLEADEVDTIMEARWMTPADLVEDGRLVAPDLPDIMAKAIRAVEGTR